MFKKIFIVSIALLIAFPALAASDDVIVNNNTTLHINNLNIDLTLKSGSKFQSATVNGGNIVFVLASGSTVTIESADRKVLTNSQSVSTNCPSNTASPSSVTFTTAGTVTLTPSTTQCTPASSGGGGGGGGGGSSTPTTITAIGSANSPVTLIITSNQDGSLKQGLANSSVVEIVVPKGSVNTQTTFSVVGATLNSNLTPTENTTSLIGGQIFDINANNSSNQKVSSFSSSLSITLTVPDMPADTTNLGVYYYNETTQKWILVPGAIFNAKDKKVIFSVNHLTKFGVFKSENSNTALDVPVSKTVDDNQTNITKSSEEIEDVISAEELLATTVNESLVKRLAGRILLQTETLGQAWYLDPITSQRYYLADGQSSYEALRKFGLGIKDSDLAKIPVGLESRFTMTDTDQDGLPDKLEEALSTDPTIADTDNDGFSDGEEIKNGFNPNGTDKLVYSTSLVNRLKGRIVLQTESRGEAWYINPVDGHRYYLANGEAAYQIMRYLSLGITNQNIQKIPVGR